MRGSSPGIVVVVVVVCGHFPERRFRTASGCHSRAHRAVVLPILVAGRVDGGCVGRWEWVGSKCWVVGVCSGRFEELLLDGCGMNGRRGLDERCVQHQIDFVGIF